MPPLVHEMSLELREGRDVTRGQISLNRHDAGVNIAVRTYGLGRVEMSVNKAGARRIIEGLSALVDPPEPVAAIAAEPEKPAGPTPRNKATHPWRKS